MEGGSYQKSLLGAVTRINRWPGAKGRGGEGGHLPPRCPKNSQIIYSTGSYLHTLYNQLFYIHIVLVPCISLLLENNFTFRATTTL